MSQGAAEVVFSLTTNSNVGSDCQSRLFQYSNGSVKIPSPWKRGRPKGSLSKRGKKLAVNESKSKKILVPTRFEFVSVSLGSIVGERSARGRPGSEGTTISLDRTTEDLEESTSQSIGTIRVRETPHAIADHSAARYGVSANLYQIRGVDLFSIYPIAFEPYMYDLLKFCTYFVLPHFCLLEHPSCNVSGRYKLTPTPFLIRRR
jgi:hypothetical protein